MLLLDRRDEKRAPLWHTFGMTKADKQHTKDEAPDADDTAATSDESAPPKEIGGRDGPDPTRYGDWEKAGRCIDF